jgi:hypothetical protein
VSLGIIHFVNMMVFWKIRGRHQADLTPPPVPRRAGVGPTPPPHPQAAPPPPPAQWADPRWSGR